MTGLSRIRSKIILNIIPIMITRREIISNVYLSRICRICRQSYIYRLRRRIYTRLIRGYRIINCYFCDTNIACYIRATSYS